MGYILLIAMVYCHIIDDYYLQGILAQMKQKSWWEKNAPDKLYEIDYIMALFEHALSWSISVHIPIIVYSLINNINTGEWLFASVLINTIIHSCVDDLKANKHKINLIIDQTIHFAQILIILFVFIWGFGLKF